MTEKKKYKLRRVKEVVKIEVHKVASQRLHIETFLRWLILAPP